EDSARLFGSDDDEDRCVCSVFVVIRSCDCCSSRRRASLGVQVTGFLEKKSTKWGSVVWKQRFFVLTHDCLHSFKKSESDALLFGEEKGNVPLVRAALARFL